MDLQHYILTLLNIPNIGNVKARKIINSSNFEPSNPEEIYDVFAEYKKNVNSKFMIPTEGEIEFAFELGKKILEDSEKAEIGILSYQNKKYPQALLQIDDHPLVLYTRGNINILNEMKAVAVIGTRRPSEYSKIMCKKLTEKLTKKGFSIISGLALGCDTIAHKSCINKNGKTIAVLPAGLDKILPRNNKKLSDSIVTSGGCLISEYPIFTEPNNGYYIQRDRIQSGMSNAIFVIETEISGGTMHTATFAKKQNRTIICMEPNDKDPRRSLFAGNVKIISKFGAIPFNNLMQIDNIIIEIIKDRKTIEKFEQLSL